MRLRLLAFVIAFCACSFAGVWLSQIDATCLDENGKPLVKATVKFSDPRTGRKFSVTTDAKGKFQYAAVQPGAYDVTVERGGVKLIAFENLGVPWSSQPLRMTVNLATRSIAFNRQTGQAESFGAEEPVETPAASSIAEDTQSLALRKAVEDAIARGDAGDWDGAIAVLKQSTETTGKNNDVIWARMGSAYYAAAKAQSEPSKELFDQSIAAYGKAIDLNAAGAYYNNRAQAELALQQWKNAELDLHAAEKANPEKRALYEMNLGAVLLEEVQAGESENTFDDLNAAVHAFDKVLVDEPDKAEAYYLRAVCQVRLLGLVDHSPSYEEIESGLRKYLEVAPNGPHADEVQKMMESISMAKATG